jgi:cyclophilin family peptidyl-prolyl cis-trans isomerase
MRHLLLLLSLALLAACQPADHGHLNRWGDDRLRPVLEAQEQRDTPALCMLLANGDAEVRAAAGLAFASVQDTAARGCLLTALSDSVPSVRAQAAFALCWIADSMVAERLRAASEAERDSGQQQAMLHAAFRAELSASEHDAQWLISFLESDDAVIRLLAAQKLARSKRPLGDTEHGVLHAVHVERDAETRSFLMLALRRGQLPESIDSLRAWMRSDAWPGGRIAALRALMQRPEAQASWAMAALNDQSIGERSTAIDLLRSRPDADGAACLAAASAEADTLLRIGLLSIARSNGDERVSQDAAAAMAVLGRGSPNPYHRAAALEASSTGAQAITLDTALARMSRPVHPAERQAAWQAANRIVRDRMMRSRFATREAQLAELLRVVQAAIATHDAGLISAAAEMVAQEEPDAIAILLPPAREAEAMAQLQPIRDLEAIGLLRLAAAMRDGLPAPPHASPRFNHPINKERLRALKQGQRYRITTAKGAIIIATDVNETPGSSLSFDSLVTAGYYNGKAFHRMVPNFVVQGGCPRGDGYGGMPWTLRTEIGRTPFTSGSVGLASAGPDTESCQFFITHSATPHLDGRYTRFGGVVSGMDVVWKIQVGDVMEKVERIE